MNTSKMTTTSIIGIIVMLIGIATFIALNHSAVGKAAVATSLFICAAIKLFEIIAKYDKLTPVFVQLCIVVGWVMMGVGVAQSAINA